MTGEENATNASTTELLQQMQTRVHWGVSDVALLFLIMVVVFGNSLVIFAVLIDRKLKTVTTNKFIASLAVSDLLVGLVVMPLSLYYKLNNDEWTLGYTWCQFHLVSGVFSTTASIVHLVAISLDRYFAIMFPTEYQRHCVSTSTLPYVVMIWVMALAVSSTLFMEQKLHSETICWIDNPQYIVLSSFLSFFLPGAIVVYLYIKIFKKLRNHQLYMFGQATQKHADKKQSLPRVIIEEVRSRRGSRMSQSGSQCGSPTRRSSKDRSPSQPDIHCVAKPLQRWRSPTICAETLAHDRCVAAKKRVSIVPDPPSMDVSISLACAAQMRAEHEQNKLREEEMKTDMDPVRKKSEEEVRKLSEERRRKIIERRRMSTQDSPNGVPIMQAFQKAYSEVRAGRRRSIQDFEYSVGQYASRTHLPTVCDDEGSPTESRSRESSFAETTPPKPSIKEDSHEESASTDASQKPLLAVPPHHRQRKSITCLPPPTFLIVPAMMAMNTPPQSPGIRENKNSTLRVPRLFDCPSPCSVPSNSSHSSYTSASSGDTFRRISMNSYGSSLTDNTDSTFEIDSRRSSAWSTLRNAVMEVGGSGRKAAVDITIDGSNGTPQKKVSSISRGKLRRIATQVTRAIRRKRRESMAIRRESRATRVVAAILIAFLICWIPYFCVSVIRGIATGFSMEINVRLHLQLYLITSWLGYAHSCFNPVIYMCLNKNFRSTMRRMIGRTRKEDH
ncbi:7 transmembrane receptor [Necator americanus]|uniref:7 transmembrane receptor n=1 Tax=Necator americanus TaxID=51031 RepID=W2TY13_NECAM|nr:7 transmembrane receptor [Necator americanus]ETN85907.1 7 transmembrane receptor [Necator americanus]